MTIREERMLANGDDDDDDDDSGAEEKKPVTKGGAKGKSTRQTSVKSDRSSMEAAEDVRSCCLDESIVSSCTDRYFVVSTARSPAVLFRLATSSRPSST